MPTYEYICSKCDQHFELFQSIAEKPLKICPKEQCGMKRWGKGKVRRAIGAGAGLIFKGSGFYATDYRSESYREAAKKETATTSPSTTGDGKPASTKGETKSETKSEAKPAPKAKAK